MSRALLEWGGHLGDSFSPARVQHPPEGQQEVVGSVYLPGLTVAWGYSDPRIFFRASYAQSGPVDLAPSGDLTGQDGHVAEVYHQVSRGVLFSPRLKPEISNSLRKSVVDSA